MDVVGGFPIADGTSANVEDRIVTMAERNRLTGMDAWRELDERYRAE